MKIRTYIQNPNKLSNEELAFIQNTKSDIKQKSNEPKTNSKAG